MEVFQRRHRPLITPRHIGRVAFVFCNCACRGDAAWGALPKLKCAVGSGLLRPTQIKTVNADFDRRKLYSHHRTASRAGIFPWRDIFHVDLDCSCLNRFVGAIKCCPGSGERCWQSPSAELMPDRDCRAQPNRNVDALSESTGSPHDSGPRQRH